MRHIIPSRPNSYTGGRLDRAGHLRADAAWLDRTRRDNASRYTLVWRGKALIAGAGSPLAALVPPPAIDAPWVFLGLQDGVAMFAADLSALEAPMDVLGPIQAGFEDLRGLTDCCQLMMRRFWRPRAAFYIGGRRMDSARDAGRRTSRPMAGMFWNARVAASSIFRVPMPR